MTLRETLIRWFDPWARKKEEEAENGRWRQAFWALRGVNLQALPGDVIGVIGKNGLLLHSQYGARLMLGGVLTTADLPAMRYPESEEPGCPPDCQICADACPAEAIMPERKQVKIMRCLSYTSRTPAMSRLKFGLIRMRDKKAAARYMSLNSFDEHTFHICSKCVSLCPYGGKE